MTVPSSKLDSKLLGDTAWNYGAFAVMAATGVILNFFIAIRFGIETLGVFNQIYAVYIVAAEHADDQASGRAIGRAAVLLAFAIGLGVALAVYLASGWIGHIADSPPVGLGIELAAPGLLFFSVNKVLMGILNGDRRMKAFALAQIGRVLAILAFALIIAFESWPGYLLGVVFTAAEVVLLPVLLALVKPWRRDAGGETAGAAGIWRRKHLDFGIKALPNGFLAESYVRVDVLMLMVFVGDAAVGVYSFAAMFVEGLYQVPVVLRTVINPVLVRLVDAGEKIELARFGRKIMAMSLGMFAAAAGLVMVIFPYLEPFFPDGLVSGAYPILVTICMGLAVYAAFVPLDFILMQAGLPGWQSGLMTLNICLNAALNLALIPIYGISGAAMATATAFALSTVTLNILVWRRLGLKGGLLFAGTRVAPFDA